MKKLLQFLAIALTGVVAIEMTACEKTPPQQTGPSVDKVKLSTDILIFSSLGGTKAVRVTGEQWTATTNDGWITVEQSEDRVTVTVETTDAARTGTVEVTNPGGTETITVTQNAPGYFLDANPKELSFSGRMAQPQLVTVETENIEWDVTVPAEFDWIHFEKNDTGVSVTVDDNPSAQPREGRLTITSSKPESAPDVEITVSQADRGTIAHNFNGASFARYLEDYSGSTPDSREFQLWLYTVEVDELGNYLPDSNGYILFLTQFSAIPANRIYPDISPGTYTLTSTQELNTAEIGVGAQRSGSLVSNFVNGTWDHTDGIVSGTYTIERKGENYIMIFDLMLEDGTELKTSYNAPLNVRNDAVLSNLGEGVTVEYSPNGGKAVLLFCGDFAMNGTWNYSMFLPSPEVTLADEFDSHGFPVYGGNGYLLRLEFYVDPDTVNRQLFLPSGTYTVNHIPDPLTIRQGSVYWGAASDSWYMQMIDGVTGPGDKNRIAAPIRSGTVTVVSPVPMVLDGTYTITYDLKDDCGNRIHGSYTGPMARTERQGLGNA